MFTTHYLTLGVTPSASAQEIREAFIRLAGVHHPDRGGDGAVMAALNEAYTALKNDRKGYNQWLSLTLRPCPKCHGRGTVAKGFKGRKKCPSCDGIGYNQKSGTGDRKC